MSCEKSGAWAKYYISVAAVDNNSGVRKGSNDSHFVRLHSFVEPVFDPQPIMIMGKEARGESIMRRLSLVASLLLLINPVQAQRTPTNSLGNLRFLIGEREGAGGGGPGSGRVPSASHLTCKIK
jgi:hypothetical protein